LPVVVEECLVHGDRRLSLADDTGATIADLRVKDFVLFAIPGEHPDHPGTGFPAGLYDIWISVLDATVAGSPPVERESNRLALQIEPNPQTEFQFDNVGGRCIETTSGPGNDEIWWDAHVGHLIPSTQPITAEHAELLLAPLEHREFPRDDWGDIEPGAQVRNGLTIWGPEVFHLHGVVCVSLVGFEVDSEDAAREQLQGFGRAFSKALLAVTGEALGIAGAASSVIERAVKAGASTKVSLTALEIGAEVLA
jgi:hypothetical protein